MTTRRLAAILAADVVGFSWMMEKDEEETLGDTIRRFEIGIYGASSPNK
jgi:class 3 adenylate cyclase